MGSDECSPQTWIIFNQTNLKNINEAGQLNWNQEQIVSNQEQSGGNSDEQQYVIPGFKDKSACRPSIDHNDQNRNKIRK